MDDLEKLKEITHESKRQMKLFAEAVIDAYVAGGGLKRRNYENSKKRP